MKNDLFELIRKMNRMTKRHAALAPSDAQDRGQGRTLHIIMDNEGITPKELMSILDIRSSSLSDKLNKLEVDGNIIRTRDRSDLRSVRIYITPKGKDAVARRLKGKDNGSNAFNYGLSAEETELFLAIGEKLCDNMKKVIKEEEDRRKRIIRMALDDSRQSMMAYEMDDEDEDKNDMNAG